MARYKVELESEIMAANWGETEGGASRVRDLAVNYEIRMVLTLQARRHHTSIRSDTYPPKTGKVIHVDIIRMSCELYSSRWHNGSLWTLEPD